MAKFYLIDHAIDVVGGHNYDYALQVSLAAEKLGFKVIVATPKRLDPASTMPSGWRVLPLFRHITCEINVEIGADTITNLNIFVYIGLRCERSVQSVLPLVGDFYRCGIFCSYLFSNQSASDS